MQLEEFRQLCNVDGKPLKKNSSDPYPLQDRTLFLVSPETQLDDTVYGVTREPTSIDIRPQLSSGWDIHDAEYKSLTGIRNQVAFQKPRFVIEQYDQEDSVNVRTLNIRTRQEHVISSNLASNVINIKSDVKINIHLADVPCGRRVCSPHVTDKVTATSESIEQSCVNLDKLNVPQVPIRHDASEVKKQMKKQSYDGYPYKGIKSSQSLFDIRDSRYKAISVESNVTTTQSDVNVTGNLYLRETDPSVEEACVILELTPTSPSCYRSNTYVYCPASGYLTAKQEKTNLIPLKDTSGSSEISVAYGDEFERRSLSTRTERTLRSRIENRKKAVRVPQVVKIDAECKMGKMEEGDETEYRSKKRIFVDAVRKIMNKEDYENEMPESQSKRMTIEKKVIGNDIAEVKFSPLEATKRKDISIEIDEDETEVIETRTKKIRIRRVISVEGDNELDSEETPKQSSEDTQYLRDDTYINEESQKVTTYDSPSVGEISTRSSREIYKMSRKHDYVKYIKVEEQQPPEIKYEINEPLQRKTITVYHKTPVVYKTTDRRPHICYRIFEPLTTPKLTEILKVPFSGETKAVPHDSRYQNKHIATKSFPSKPSIDTNDGIRPIQSIAYETIERINETLFEEYITINGKIYRRTGSDKVPSPKSLYRPLPDRSTVPEHQTDLEDSKVSLAKPISFILKQKSNNKKDVEPFPTAVSSSDDRNGQHLTDRTVHKDVSKDDGALYYITSIRPKLSNAERRDSNSTPYIVHLPSEIKNERSTMESEVTEKQSRTSKISRRYKSLEPVESENELPVRQLNTSTTEITETNYEENTPTRNKNVDNVTEFEQMVTEKQSRTSKLSRRHENDANLDLTQRETKVSQNKPMSVRQPKRSKTEITREEIEIVENKTEYIHEHKKRMRYDTTMKAIPEGSKNQKQPVQDDKGTRNINVNEENILQLKEVEDIKSQEKPIKNHTISSFIVNNNILPLKEFELKKYRQENCMKEEPNKDINIVREVVTGKRPEPRKGDVLIKSTTRKEREPERKAVCQDIKYGMKANEHHSQTNQTEHGVIHEVVDVKEVVRGKIKIFNEVKVKHNSQLHESKHSVQTIRSRPLITSVHSEANQSNALSNESEKSSYQVTLAPSHLQVPMHDTTNLSRYPQIAEDKKLYEEESPNNPEPTSEENIYEETTSFKEERNETIYKKKQTFYRGNVIKGNINKTNGQNQDDASPNQNNITENKIRFERKLLTDSKDNDDNQNMDTTLESDLHKQNLNHETNKFTGNRVSSTVIEEKIDEIHKESNNVKKIRKKDDENHERQIRKPSLLIQKDDKYEVEHKKDDIVTKTESISEDEFYYRTKEMPNDEIVEETVTINESTFEETVSVRKETFVKKDRTRKAERETQLVQDGPTPPTHSAHSDDHKPIFEIYYGNMKPESEQNVSDVTTTENETSKVKQTARNKESEITEPEHVIEVISKKEINEPEIFIINKLPKDRLIILEALPVESKGSTKVTTTEQNLKHKYYKVYRKTEASNSKFYFGSAKPPPVPVNELIDDNLKEPTFIKEKSLKSTDVKSTNPNVEQYVEDVTIEEKKAHTHEYKQYKKVTINTPKQETINQKIDDKLPISKINEIQLKLKENEANVGTSQNQFSSQDNKSLPVFIETLAKDDAGEDSVVIYIRQEKTPASHIQPTITIDYTKTKDMTVSDLDMQKVCIREMNPTTSQIMSEQSVFPNKSDGKFLRVDDSVYISTKDTSGASNIPLVSNEEFRKLSTFTQDGKSHFMFNTAQPFTVAYSPIGTGGRFKSPSKTQLVWKNRSMRPDTSAENVAKPEGVATADEETLKKTLSSKGMCCSEYYPDTDPLSKVFPSTCKLFLLS